MRLVSSSRMLLVRIIGPETAACPVVAQAIPACLGARGLSRVLLKAAFIAFLL